MNLKIFGKYIKFPKEYKKVKKDTFRYKNDLTQAQVGIKDITKGLTLPFDDVRLIYYTFIHNYLDEHLDFGLIKIDKGNTYNGLKYVYYIYKRAVKVKGIFAYNEYNLHMNVKIGNKIKSIAGTFIEDKKICHREQEMFTKLIKEGVLKDEYDTEHWLEDPYNCKQRKGNLMNLSDSEQYDKDYPLHALSICRKFVRDILTIN